MLQEDPSREKPQSRTRRQRPFAIGMSLVLLGLLAVFCLGAAALGVITEGNLFPLLFLLPAVCLFLTAMGVARYRGWARIAVLVVSGMLAAFCPFAIAIDAVVLGKQLYLGLPTVYLVIYAAANIIYLFLTILGVWWLVYFNRRRTKALFCRAAD